MNRFGQTNGLLEGIRIAHYPIVVTLDIDLENPPELIPRLLKIFNENELDLLVASRSILPRISERFASRIIGRIVGVRDVYSNFRIYKRELFKDYKPILGETFGGELLVYACANKYRIGEYIYDPPQRRARPRIGGIVKANTRIFIATAKLLMYIAFRRSDRL